MIELYDDVTIQTMKDTLESFGVEIDPTMKKKSDIYELYVKTLKENKSEEKAEEKVEEISEEIIEEVVVETVEKVEKPKAIRDIKPDELIEVKSVTYHGLTYVCPKTGSIYNWDEYGKVELMTMQELITMNSNSPTFLTDPNILIEDEDVVRKLRLEEVYKTFLDEDTIMELIHRPMAELKLSLDATAPAIKSKIFDIVKREVGKSLTDFSRVRFFESYFNTTL